jgi:transposase
MQKRDGRSIPDAALEVLRERAVAMHQAGNAQLAIAAALGVHKNTVHQWLKGWRVAGAAALNRPLPNASISGRELAGS